MADPGETLGSLWIPLAMGVWEGVAMDSLEYHLAMHDPSTPCERATLETVLRPFLGWATRRAGGLQPSSSLLDTLCHTPMALAIRAYQGWPPAGHH
jgi:hypothetical protein